MDDGTALDRGRLALERQEWAVAYDLLARADRESPFEPSDLEALARVAYLVGEDEASVDFWARAYQRALERGDPQTAARCAFWPAFQLLNAGSAAQGGGWLARAQHQVDACGDECVVRGYVLAASGIQSISSGDLGSAKTAFEAAQALGDQFADPDLLALSRLGLGHVAVLEGDHAAGVALFDEVMVSVTAGEVLPVVAGLAYCATIIVCQELYDLRRATEWTRALSHWCEDQPDLVPYRGQCLVHRAEIMQLHGAWPDSMREIQLARARLSDPPGQPAVGMAYYQQGELHRLRGEFAQAEKDYRTALEYGREPQPGLALLALAQGRTDIARSALRQALDVTTDRLGRSKLLPACVDVELAAGDVERAVAAADELSALADTLPAPLLLAMASQARGSVDLAAGRLQPSLVALRRSWAAWREIGAPYEAARVRVLIGLARREMGDAESAEMELDAARSAFQQLGAAHDVVTVERLMQQGAPAAAGALTVRELEVLKLLATGATNRAIAVELVISEKTVARHVSNIFTKLDVTSRSGATSFAYEHGLA